MKGERKGRRNRSPLTVRIAVREKPCGTGIGAGSSPWLVNPNYYKIRVRGKKE
jgi:hypothetical protein